MARTLTVMIVGDTNDLNKGLGGALVLSPIVAALFVTFVSPASRTIQRGRNYLL